MLKAAIYCRLSDEDMNKSCRLEESESIRNQKLLLSRYALDKGWDIYDIYSDEDYSGLDRDRPEWNRLLKDAEAGKFDIVLCKSQSRFTRDMELAEKYLNGKFMEWNIRFIGLADNSDTSNKGNKKQRQIMGLTNEWYCEDVSDNIKAVFNMKRRKGLFIGSFAPYGYMKDPDNRNRLIVDEAAAEIVREIFHWYMEGYGTQQIAYMLNNRGIPNPTKYKQSAGLCYRNAGMRNDLGLWNKNTIRRILRNEMYIGNMVQGIRRKISYKSKKIISVPKEEWIRAEATHEPIIPGDLFEEVQRRMDKRQRSTEKGQAHILAGKVFCAGCGSSMIKVTSYSKGGKQYSYLRCSLYGVSGSRHLCTGHSIRLDELQAVIAGRLKEELGIVGEEEAARRLQERMEWSSGIRRLQNDMASIEKRLRQNALMRKNLYLDKLGEKIGQEQYDLLDSELLAEREGLVKRKETAEKLICKLYEDIGNADSARELIIKYKDFDKLTRTMVNEFIEYVRIGERDRKTGEREITIKWRF